MKVLNIINNLGSGGAERLVVDSSNLLSKEIKVDILTLSNKDNRFEEDLKINDNLKFYSLNAQNIRYPLRANEITSFLKKNNYDIVHVHLFPSQYHVALASYFIDQNIKLVTTEHNTTNKRRENKIFKKIDSWMYSRYDKIISISNSTMKNLREWIQEEEPKRHQVIYNGVNLEKYKGANSKNLSDIDPKIKDNYKTIVMVARFTEQKDHTTLLRALKLLESKNIQLLLIGEGPLLSQTKSLVSKLGLNNVHFIGYRNDVEQILKSTDMMVLSSNYEGFGLVSIEGMASELPVLVSDVEGLNEVVDNSAYRFKTGDYEDLAKKINKILFNEKNYENAQQYSIKRVNDFSLETYCKNLLNCYKELFQHNGDIK